MSASRFVSVASFLRRALSFVVFLLALSAIGRARAEEPTWPLVGPAFGASVEEIQKAAASLPTEKFSEATILFERDTYAFDEAGRVTYRHTLVYRIESQTGVDGWSETSLRWEPWYQNQPEIRARVIAPDGKVSQLDQKTVTDGPAKEDSEDTYTDARIRKAPLPGVTVGAIVEEETTVTDKQPFFSGGGLYRANYWRSVPIVRAELTVDAPKELNLQYRVHVMPQVRISDEVKNGRRQLRFEQGYLPARANSDIDLATHEFFWPMIEFSTGQSWAAVASAYRELAEAHVDPAAVKGILPAGADGDRMATIAKIVAWLHKEVRYTGLEFGEAALQPATAAEVLKHHYGDCKDKAALLVAMLRAAGIGANIALLDTGPGVDVTPELPGMNEFDHAIVYVPAQAGADGLWIDATAEFEEVGTLPSMDEGRMALIIAEGTKGLMQTPAAKPEDDRLTELRDVSLAEYGPSHITETSVTHGEIDASYREWYGGEETREKKAKLEKYAKDEYLAKTLESVRHGDAQDLTKPFGLRLQTTEAKRGDTSMEDAAVGITFGDIFGRLPRWFKTDPKVEGEKLTPQEEENRKRAAAARAGEYDVHPFVTEWRYTITPPAGFVLRALPEDKSIAMGPAKLTQHYEKDAKGAIAATLSFDTVKPRYTVEEVLALRDAVLASYKQDMIKIVFDQAGAKLVAAGKIREGLAADRALIELHPTEGLHHAQIAYAFLKAGMGGKARAEAKQATVLDPKSPVGFRALGWICQFNEIGIQFGSGFDWDCAANALKKAVELEPDDSTTALNLAILDEYDKQGERYSTDAPMADAVRAYHAVKQKDKAVGEQYEDNVLYDLLYSKQYKELLDEVEKLTSSPTRRAFAISATVALQGGTKGITAGIDRADHLGAGADERNAALALAGNQLMRMRLYPEAAGILTAGVEGTDNSASVQQQIAIFQQLKKWNNEYLPASDPRGVVQRMFLAFMIGNFTEATANELLTRHAYESDDAWRRNYEKTIESRGMLHTMATQSGLSANVLLDLIAENLKLSAEGNDETGYRITVQSLGAQPLHFFVTKENSTYKVVTDGNTPQEAGNEVLYLLRTGREKEARSLLDWVRDNMHRGGGDDPLSGPLLPRFWSVGDAGDAVAMKTAAASLVAGSPAIKELLPEVRTAWEKAQTDEARLNLGLILSYGYVSSEDGANLKAVSAEILKKYPDSYAAIALAGLADAMLKDWKDWREMLDIRLAKHPDDENLLRMKVGYGEEKGEWELARATLHTLIDKGKASPEDYNNYGWMALFDGKDIDESVKQAQQANMLTKNTNFGQLHTLACLYAYEGKTAEARDLLLKAMAAANEAVPNAAVWYGLGSIYEQYGVTDAAIEAYRKVEMPPRRVGPTDTYVLAKARLTALTAGVQGASATH